MNINVFTLVCAATVGFASLGFAQEESFDQYKKREQKQYEKYKEDSDREFLEFLRKSWEEMELMKGTGSFQKPKPPRIQPRKEAGAEAVPGPDRSLPVTIPKQTVTEIPTPPVARETVHPAAAPVFTVDFFGTPLAFPVSEKIPVPRLTRVDDEAIAGAWKEMSAAASGPIMKRSASYREQLHLNDWGYCRLLYALGLSLGNGTTRSAVVFTWYTLNKAGIDARVGYTDDNIFLLLGSQQTLFGSSFLTMKQTGRKYYLVTLDPSVELPRTSLYSYDGTPPGESRLCNFALTEPPGLKAEEFSKTLTFSYRGKEYSVPVIIRRDAVRFFEYYPQTEFPVYFSSPASVQATASLVKGLRPLIEGKSEWEAVNTLLHFVQGGFRYITDQVAFGREKPMFPDETLFYPACDCEDRSILFAHLVGTLTGLDVIGLDFPGHIATAVHFRGEVKGDGIAYKGKRYVVCDPTYLNADVGESMPGMKVSEASIISW